MITLIPMTFIDMLKAENHNCRFILDRNYVIPDEHAQCLYVRSTCIIL